MTDAGTTERQLKVTVAPDFVVPSFEGFEPLASAASSVALHATYWDTEELTLAGWGHTLRVRGADDGAEHGWTLKLAAGSGDLVVRRELNVAGAMDRPPLAALDVVRTLVGRRRLVPVAGIDTVRRRQRVRHLATGTVLEIDDDLVTSVVAGFDGPSFREVEVELLEGDVKVLDSIAEALHEVGAGRPDPTPKLFRVLSDRLPAPPHGPGKHGPGKRPRTAAALVGAAIAAGTRQLLVQDPVIRLGGDAEAVHQARVSVRRLRANLKTLGAVLDPFRVDGLRRELAWLGAVLGEVRDRDVLATTLARYADHVDGLDGGAVDGLYRHLERERAVSLRVLLDVMGSSRYQGLVADLSRLADDPPLRPGYPVKTPAREAGHELAGAAFARLERKVRRLPSRPAAAELHELRKTAKQARYAAELVSPLAKGRTDRLARRLGDLQDRLGDQQDEAILLRWLVDLPFGQVGGPTAFAAGRVAQEVARSVAEAESAWHASWSAVKVAHHRSWLG